MVSALTNIMGGKYVQKVEAAPSVELSAGSLDTLGLKSPSILEEGTYLWDADSLHKSSSRSSQHQSRSLLSSETESVLDEIMTTKDTPERTR